MQPHSSPVTHESHTRVDALRAHSRFNQSLICFISKLVALKHAIPSLVFQHSCNSSLRSETPLTYIPRNFTCVRAANHQHLCIDEQVEILIGFTICLKRDLILACHRDTLLDASSHDHTWSCSFYQASLQPNQSPHAPGSPRASTQWVSSFLLARQNTTRLSSTMLLLPTFLPWNRHCSATMFCRVSALLLLC